MRAEQLHVEMKRQGIEEYKIWASIHIPNKPKRTGISLAHKQIVEWALIEQQPEVCIMEDDVFFPAEDGFQYFLKNKPYEYDLYLGGISRGDIDADNITRRFSGMFCYFIHEKFYTRFLRANEDLDIDGAMGEIRGKYVVCNPMAAFVYPTWSDNVNGMMDYSHLLQNREVYGFGTVISEEDSRRFSDFAKSHIKI